MIIEGGRIFTRSGRFFEGSIRFEKVIMEIGRIHPAEDEPCLQVGGGYVIPGLVDIHTHGAMGYDVCDASSEGLQAMSCFFAKNGVTSFCPTTMTLPENRLEEAVKSIADTALSGAKCAGVHMEGPFINPLRKGSQSEEHIQLPNVDLFRRLNDISGGLIRIVDIAPERDEDFRFIREVSRVCHVSFGHTDTDYQTAMNGFASGADHVTHLFNAMSPYHQFDPGLIGAAADSGAYVEVICDGYHIHPSIVRSLFRLFSPDRICFISDSHCCAGMPEGSYDSQGQAIFVKNGKVTLENGLLAGTAIHLLEMVRRAVSYGVPLEMAVAAAAHNPAMAIGMQDSIGMLTPGTNADIVVLDKDLQVRQVFLQGEAFLP